MSIIELNCNNAEDIRETLLLRGGIFSTAHLIITLQCSLQKQFAVSSHNEVPTWKFERRKRIEDDRETVENKKTIAGNREYTTKYQPSKGPKALFGNKQLLLAFQEFIFIGSCPADFICIPKTLLCVVQNRVCNTMNTLWKIARLPTPCVISRLETFAAQ